MRMRFLWKWSWHSWTSQQGVVSAFCSSKTFKFILKTAITCILSRSYDIFIHSRMLSLSRFSVVDFLHKKTTTRRLGSEKISLFTSSSSPPPQILIAVLLDIQKKLFQYKKFLSHHQIPQQSNNRNFLLHSRAFRVKMATKTAKNMLAAVTTNIGIWLKKFMPLNCV